MAGTNRVKSGTIANLKTDSLQICAISDGRAGNARQAEALASALADGGAVSTLALDPRAPWRWLSPRRLPGAETAFGAGFAALLDATPGLAIGCGRQAALATRLLRERGWRTVQILDPRIEPRPVRTPWWSPANTTACTKTTCVVTARRRCNDIDDASLARARQDFWPAVRCNCLRAAHRRCCWAAAARALPFDRMAYWRALATRNWEAMAHA